MLEYAHDFPLGLMRPLAQGDSDVFRLFPDSASAAARQIDLIFIGLIIMALLFIVFLFGMMAFFLVRYRAGSKAPRSSVIRKTWRYEITWTAAATVIAIILFVWAAKVYFSLHSPPPDAQTYYVVGRQWMWEIQHPSGRRELNALHIPLGQPVKLVLTSEDVIHSFFVPAFRMKQDAVPGRYTTAWFMPTKPGVYHLFCAEYCGSDHARMTGQIFVLRHDEYEQWLQQTPVPPTAQPLVATGQMSFQVLGCNQCHLPDNDSLAPYLEDLYGRTVTVQDGSTLVADEQYIRESIIDPAAKVVRGYQPIMPTYKGMLDERQLAQLVAAVRGLTREQPLESAP
jgi:cytochrome c oxidase subunit 2